MAGFIDRLLSDPIKTIGEIGSYIIGGGSGTDSGAGNYGWVMPLVTAGLGTIGAYNAEDDTPYANTREGFEAQQALAREQLAQQMEIAKMNAASAGAGSGAAVTAARIAADSQMKQLRKKIVADQLAKSMDIAQGAVGLGQASQTNYAQSKYQGGALAQQGLQGVAQLLASARR